MIQSDLFDTYVEQNSITFSGNSGVAHLQKLLHDVCGYYSTDKNVIVEFLADNPPALASLVDWIVANGQNGWNDKLQQLVSGTKIS